MKEYLLVWKNDCILKIFQQVINSIHSMISYMRARQTDRHKLEPNVHSGYFQERYYE